MSEPPPDDEIFAELAPLSLGDRAALLTRRCADAAQRARLEALLAAYDSPEDFLTAPSTGPIAEGEGDRVGRYKLLQKIGEGGFGVVWVAEQKEPVHRRVALKIIKPGMDTKEVVARFEAERQALALMDHPNIARVFDGGTTTAGRPYFVMELVRGVPITRYCDENSLPANTRLGLFIQVCQAVQHAHQKGVIHRDLKPSNILITVNDGQPVPKVIDFGIAKAIQGRLTDRTLYTAFEQFIGTPAYMSPEQVEMSSVDVDTRSDIYTLGALLYELLTGQTPFDTKSLLRAGIDEVRRVIREIEPPRPSARLSTLPDADCTTVAKLRNTAPAQLTKLLRGDLDWIVMRCLEKDRRRRYETANGLALDLHRYLRNEPVSARPPSRAYLLQKLVRRHRFAFAAGAVVAIALLLGIVGSLWQARRAEAGERKARIEAARSETAARFMRDMLEGVGPAIARGRDTVLLREIVDATARRLDRDLAGQPEVEADLRETLGVLYKELAEFNLSLAMLEKSLALRREVHGSEHPSVARTMGLLGDSLSRLGRLKESERLLQEALAMRRRLQPDDDLAIADSLYVLAEVTRRQRRHAEAAVLYEEALALRRKKLGPVHPDIAKAISALAISESEGLGKVAEGDRHFREALAMQRGLFGEEHPSVVATMAGLANLKIYEGKYREAEALLRETIAIKRRNYHPTHTTIGNGLLSLGELLVQCGRRNEAIDTLREAKDIFEARVGGGNFQAVNTNISLGMALGREGRWEEAYAALESAHALSQQQLGANDSRSIAAESEFAWASYNLGRRDEARALAEHVVAVSPNKIGTIEPNISGAFYVLGWLDVSAGRTDTDVRYFQQAIQLNEKLFRTNQAEALLSRTQLALAQLSAGNVAEARALFEPILAAQRVTENVNPADIATTLTGLADALQREGRAAEAEALRQEAATLRRQGTM